LLSFAPVGDRQAESGSNLRQEQKADFEPEAAWGKDLDFEPGENARYSNSGYVLLGLIIEKVAGQSYVEYIRGHILSPAGMENSGYREDYQAARDFARGASEGRDGHLVLAPYIAVLSNVSSAPAGEIGRTAWPRSSLVRTISCLNPASVVYRCTSGGLSGETSLSIY